MNDIAFIKLVNCDKYAVVDADLFPALNQFRWRRDNAGHAVRYEYQRGDPSAPWKDIARRGKQVCIMMHRVINQTPEGLFTDHIDHDRLNNRRCNLRSATCSQSQMNTRKGRTRLFSAKFKGVCFVSARKTWQAKLQDRGRTIHLGAFLKEEDAARAYDIGALKYYGQYACTNFQRANYDGLDLDKELEKYRIENVNRRGVGVKPWKYRGVCYDRLRDRFVSTLKHNGDTIVVGSFTDPETAARSYDLVSLKLRGPCAPTNFPKVNYEGLNLDDEIAQYKRANMRRRVELHRKP